MIVLALAVLVALGLLGIVGYVWACGTERWLVKVGDAVERRLLEREVAECQHPLLHPN